MLLIQEEDITNCYINIKTPILSLIEDSIELNDTIKIQDNILEFRAGLGDTNLIVNNEPNITVMV
jgi:hypothetical protein